MITSSIGPKYAFGTEQQIAFLRDFAHIDNISKTISDHLCILVGIELRKAITSSIMCSKPQANVDKQTSTPGNPV